MQQLRYSVNRNPKISNGGWHFSFMGGANKIIEKLNAYAETQTNSEEINRQNVINYKIANGYDLFNRADLKYEIVEIDQLYPLEVISFLNKYPSFHLTADKLEEYKQIKIEGLNLSKNYTKRSVLFRLLKKIYKLYLRFL